MTTSIRTVATRLVLAAALAACGRGAEQAGDSASAPAGDALPAGVAAAAQAISAESLLAHVKDLSADSMEGRGPATPGEEKTIAYLTRQFQALGLQPGNPDGTWVQQADLVGYTSRPTASFTTGGKTIALAFPDDYVANSRHQRPETKVAN